MSRRDYSLFTAGFFFVLFLVFFLFISPSLTGFVTLTPSATSGSVGSVAGNLHLVFEAQDFLPNNTIVTVTVLGNSGIVTSATKDLNFLLNQSMHVPLTQQNNVNGFGSGTHDVNLGLFSLSINSAGTYTLNVSVANASMTFVVASTQFTLSAASSSKPTISSVTLLAASSKDQFLNANYSGFFVGSYLGCRVAFSDGVLNLSIYKPGDTVPGNPYKLFSPDELTCDSGMCVGGIVVNQTFLGQWGCYAEASNPNGKSTPKISTPLMMLNTPPILLDTISDFSFTPDATGKQSLDLSLAFSDPDHQSLQYDAVGLQFLQLTKDGSKLSLSNPSHGVGNETISFFAFDGYNYTYSPNVTISVSGAVQNMTNTVNQTCTSQWVCQWGSCQNGMQTKTCTDTAQCATGVNPGGQTQNCTAEVTPPAAADDLQLINTPEENKVVSDQAPFAWWQILLLSLGVLAMICGGVLFYIQHKKEKAASVLSKPEEKPAEEKVGEAVTPAQPVQQNTQDLQAYVEKLMIEYGKNQAEIEPSLLQAGWNADDVKKVCKFVTLKSFIKKKLDSGFSVDDVKKAVLTKGWKPELVEQCLKELGKI